MTVRIYAACAMALLLALGGVATGWKAANWRRDSQDLAIERAAQKAGESASAAAVAAIQNNRPKYVTIQNEVQRETRIEPRYVAAECQHTDAVWLQISAAYEALGVPPLDRTGLPQPEPASGPDAGGDNPRSH